MSRYAEKTTVTSEKSRNEIEATLRRYGATSFAYGWNGDNAQIGFQLGNRAIRFNLPMRRLGGRGPATHQTLPPIRATGKGKGRPGRQVAHQVQRKP